MAAWKCEIIRHLISIDMLLILAVICVLLIIVLNTSRVAWGELCNDCVKLSVVCKLLVFGDSNILSYHLWLSNMFLEAEIC